MMVTLFLLALCLTSTFAKAPSTVSPSVGYFPGRSADIIIQSESTSVQDSVILFKGDQFSTTQLTQMEDTRFADLFAHVMGTQSFHVDADRNGFPTTSLFNKPRAAAIVALDSVGAEILRKYPTLSLLQNAHAAALTSQSLPVNTHTLLANFATGKGPSTHGIVGATWRKPVTGKRVEAYSDDGLSFAANVADILLQETEGLSLVVSASASPSFASALGGHPDLVSDNIGWRAHTYSLDRNAFATRYESPSVDQVLAMSSIDTAEVSVKVGNVEVVFRPLENNADFELIAELAFVKNLIAKLQTNPLLASQVKDSVPDLYSIVFSSLKGIQARNGEQSDAFAAALTLVDEACANLLSTLDALYDNRVAVAVVALNARDISSQTQRQAIFSKVHKILYDQADFTTYYPNVYVRTEEFNGYTRNIMCSNLQQSINNAKVLCVSPFLPVRDVRSLGNDTNCTVNCTVPPVDHTDYLWAFWLNFFITIIIVSFVGWGVYCLTFVGIDASKDTLLFRTAGKQFNK